MAVKSGFEGKRVSAWLILIPVAVLGLTIFSFIELRASVHGAQASLLTSASERIALRVSGQLSALLDVGQQFRSILLEEGATGYGSMKSLADTSLHRYSFIDSITIAPGAIIRYSFPENSASASIGHDLLDNSERMQALVQAVSKKQVVLQGPDTSAEGKDLAFLRFPVFRANDLWGFISIGIDVDNLLNTLNFNDEFPGLRIACAARGQGSGADPGGSRAFWGDERAVLGYSSPIALGADDSGWSMSVASVYPVSRAIWWGGAIAMLAIMSVAGLFSFSFRTRTNSKIKPRPHRDRFDVSPFSSFAPFEKQADTNHEPAPKSATAKESLENLPLESMQSAAVSIPRVVDPKISQELDKQPNAEERQEDIPQPPPVATAPSEENHRTPASVLVVDDSEVNRELLARMLTLKGYLVESRAGGELALAMLDTRDFDVLLIDCIMPDMDGYALASAVRRRTALPSSDGDGLLSKAPKLIAMSPRHDAEEAEKCVRAGFDGLLIKPFTMTSLDQKIKEMLDASPHAGL